MPGAEFRHKKDTKVTLTFSNPVNFNTKIQFTQVEGNAGEHVTAKVFVIESLTGYYWERWLVTTENFDWLLLGTLTRY